MHAWCLPCKGGHSLYMHVLRLKTAYDVASGRRPPPWCTARGWYAHARPYMQAPNPSTKNAGACPVALVSCITSSAASFVLRLYLGLELIKKSPFFLLVCGLSVLRSVDPTMRS